MISRRTLVAAAPLALAACGRAEEAYFGKTDPPPRQRLVSVLGVEPGPLDPTTSAELIEQRVIYALFEGLTTIDPQTGEAMAGLATHCTVTADGLRHTFYLRGHPEPRGVRLKDRSDLPHEYSRNRPAPPDFQPAKWSDGVRITASDFVYSWQRAVNPATAAMFVYLMRCLANAAEIISGKMPPEKLGVRAIDEFTLQVDLHSPVAFFLELVATLYFCPVPRHVVETAGKFWTEPGRMVTSGAFTLHERRPNEKIVLIRNRSYYDSQVVSLEELVFLPVIDAAAGANLYRTAEAAMSSLITPTLIPVLQRKKDFRLTPVFGLMWASLKTTQPPLTDIRIRYALNMAIDKQAIAGMTPGQTPAVNLIPPIRSYEPPRSLNVELGNSGINVLAFDPRAARELLEGAVGRKPLHLTYAHPPFSNFKLAALILQQQWQQTLGIELDLVQLDVATWVQAALDTRYPGMVANGDSSPYLDPSYLLEQFTSTGASGCDWTDAIYDAMVAEAGATADRESRLEKLAQCERRLLRAMPIVPLSTFVFPNLAKPYVRGLGTNPLDRQQFKYVWIDTNWRPA